MRKRLVGTLVDALLARYEGSFATSARADVQLQHIQRWATRDLPVMSVMSTCDANAMNDLVAALLRVDAGTYGICATCGSPIGYQRLIESPTTTSCASCAYNEAWRPSRSPG